VSSASAKTPDGKTPAQETVCDNEKSDGGAFGLCNAYCEAMDCTDPNQHASDKGCASVKKNYIKKTGRPLPCEVTCPCPGLLQLFADINAGAVTVTRCIASDSFLFVRTTGGETAIIDEGPPATCSANGEPPFVELTATEKLVCRVNLRKLVESRGVRCTEPE
jgi:hypothetical protein